MTRNKTLKQHLGFNLLQFVFSFLVGFKFAPFYACLSEVVQPLVPNILLHPSPLGYQILHKFCKRLFVQFKWTHRSSHMVCKVNFEHKLPQLTKIRNKTLEHYPSVLLLLLQLSCCWPPSDLLEEKSNIT